MELNAATKSVSEIFSVDKRYLVPRFQREYSWDKEELEEFWEDIILQIKNDKNILTNNEYFIGCIVLIGEDTKKDYSIVDGQQRLTTLTIFLKAIVKRLMELGEEDAAKALYHNYIEGKDDDGKVYFKFVNETPKPYFQTEIQIFEPLTDNKATTEEEKLLSSAFEFFNKQLKNYSHEGFSEIDSVKSLRKQILDFLKFILVTAKSEEDAYTIFETLNAKGISLTSVDLIKNWIFKNYDLTHPDDDAKTTWEYIKTKVSQSNEKVENFFRHYWNSKYSFSSDARLYKSFNIYLKKGKIQDAKSFIKDIKNASERYRKICTPHIKDWGTQKERSVVKYLEKINQYNVKQARPFLLALLEAREEGLVGETDFINVIRNLENFHFLFSNLCSSRASGLESIYTQTARKLYSTTDKNKIKDELLNLQKTLKSKLPSEQIIEGAVSQLQLTKKNDADKKTIRMIFHKIEEHLLETKELGVSDFSIEHISDESQNQLWTGNVGNLIMLDEKLNNEIKENQSFEAKKKIYMKSQFKVVNQFLKDNTQTDWNENKSEEWKATIIKKLIAATKF